MCKKISMVVLACIFTGLIQAQTAGSLTVSATTSSAGGNYAPRNVVAIWVEDSSGAFVKTLLAYANTRKTHLNTWEASTTTAGTAFNTTDAVSGATQSNHHTRTCEWNGKNYKGTLVADGEYKLRMELTDKNATGNAASFSFTKSTAGQSLTPEKVPSFSSISITWTPLSTGLDVEPTPGNTFVVYPNPGTGKFTVLGEGITGLEVKDMTGRVVVTSTTPQVNLSGQPHGTYLITIRTAKATIVQKIMKE